MFKLQTYTENNTFIVEIRCKRVLSFVKLSIRLLSSLAEVKFPKLNTF